jgi:hypothetical protein
MRTLKALNSGPIWTTDALELEYGCVDWFDYQVDRRPKPAGAAVSAARTALGAAASTAGRYHGKRSEPQSTSSLSIAGDES